MSYDYQGFYEYYTTHKEPTYIPPQHAYSKFADEYAARIAQRSSDYSVSVLKKGSTLRHCESVYADFAMACSMQTNSMGEIISFHDFAFSFESPDELSYRKQVIGQLNTMVTHLQMNQDEYGEETDLNQKGINFIESFKNRYQHVYDFYEAVRKNEVPVEIYEKNIKPDYPPLRSLFCDLKSMADNYVLEYDAVYRGFSQPLKDVLKSSCSELPADESFLDTKAMAGVLKTLDETFGHLRRDASYMVSSDGNSVTFANSCAKSFCSSLVDLDNKDIMSYVPYLSKMVVDSVSVVDKYLHYDFSFKDDGYQSSDIHHIEDDTKTLISLCDSVYKGFSQLYSYNFMDLEQRKEFHQSLNSQETILNKLMLSDEIFVKKQSPLKSR